MSTSGITATLADQTRLLVRISEVDLRLEGVQAETQRRLDRIEERYTLRDAA